MCAQEIRIYSVTGMKKELYDYRKDNGLCVDCGMPLDISGIFCKHCRKMRLDYKQRPEVKEKLNAANRKMKHKRKEAGLCVTCGKPLDREATMCSACWEKTKQWRKEQREWYLSRKICPVCRVNTVFGDEKTCLDCQMKNIERTQGNIEKNRDAYNARMRDYQKRRREELKANGICTRCGKRPASNGYSRCEMCRAKEKDYYYNKNDGVRLRRAYRHEYGLCYICGEPNLNGYNLCPKCYERAVQNLVNGYATERSKQSEY